jgi:hypothetical protein
MLDEVIKPFEQQSVEYRALKDTIRENVLTLISSAMSKTKQLRELMQNEISRDTE